MDKEDSDVDLGKFRPKWLLPEVPGENISYLKKIRLKANLSLKEAGMLCGLSEGHFCSIEGNRKFVTLKTLPNLRKFLQAVGYDAKEADKYIL